MTVLASTAASVAFAERRAPILHEFLKPNLAEDIDFSTTRAAGQLPVAVRTPSGLIAPPDVRRTPDPDRVYQRATGPNGGFEFRPDRDTRRPDVERYDDPFTPNLTPFKRTYAYDGVREDYSLYVRGGPPAALEVGGAATDEDDRFFADLSVALTPGAPVRIPTVGPDARILSAVRRPDVPLEFLVDSAGNWFVQGEQSRRIRLVLDIAVEREVFASEYADVAWSALPRVPLQPAEHRRAFEKVRGAIGISRATMSPRAVVIAMVEYFRSFTPSDEPPSGQGDIYVDLALSRKGVCRHRAFGFLVTALNIGIPARLIHNEAHAWVEVRDHERWHRIDLGGAALDLDEDVSLERPPHVPPPDQFAWPTGRDSGADLAHRTREEAQERSAASDASEGGRSGTGPREAERSGRNGAGDDADDAEIDPFAPPDPDAPSSAGERPETALTIDEIDADIFRGLPVKIRGQATSNGQPCARLRVDIMLSLEGEPDDLRLGSLSTDEKGRYAGEVVVPGGIPVGDHELSVATPGHQRCGRGVAD
ncbi:MAG: transglutaminase-like domain-containing protein [Myxococcota bacterium]